jgi:16S rRNA (guanine527-N7)-methyltransferase
VEAPRSFDFLSLLTPETIAALLEPYVGGETPDVARICGQLATYLDLILKWNAKLNLTAIRTPEEIVRRHFGESLFAGTHVGPCTTLLDFGSGAGFPGIPIQLLRPDVSVTLAESQGKKAAFLREAVRTLDLATEVYAGRVEAMPPATQFDTVALRAVDNMEAAVREAGRRAARQVLILGTSRTRLSPLLGANFVQSAQISVPGTSEGVLEILRRR